MLKNHVVLEKLGISWTLAMCFLVGAAVLCSLSAILFAIGAAGVFLRRNLITLLLSIEIMLNALNLTFVAAGRSASGRLLPTFSAKAIQLASSSLSLPLLW